MLGIPEKPPYVSLYLNVMKKHILTFFFLFISFIALTQAPQGIPYQAIARNGAGNALVSQNISVKFSILNGSPSGSAVYVETHTTTTSVLGLFTLTVGNGTPQIGTFLGINWAIGTKFLQVELDPAGGTSYINLGTTQMMSVPYALYAATSGTPGVTGATGPQGIQGITGATGPIGLTGANGATGVTGLQGIQGVAGPTGATGANGTNGATGPTGLQGIQGVAGPTGATGANGTNGVNGATGATGPIGATGPTGANGTNGVNGATGAAGPIGATGPTGANGANGVTGSAGPVGATGATGSAGVGVPSGGTTGQVLTKVDGTNFNTSWTTPSAASSASIVVDAATVSGTPSNSNVFGSSNGAQIYTTTLASSGIYMVSFSLKSTAPGGTNIIAYLRLNTTDIAYDGGYYNAGGANDAIVNVTGIVNATAGNTISIRVSDSAGTNPITGKITIVKL